MSTLEEKIKKILEESSEPLRAVEIAKKIGHGYEKKDVNRVIYSMPDVEKVDKSPPKWRIRSRHGICPEDTPIASASTINSAEVMAQRGVSTPQIEATSQAGEGQSNPSQGSDLELQEKLLKVLKQSPKPKSALQLARELGKEGRRDVNPILHRLEKQGLVRKLSEDTDTKPLWQSVVHPVHSTSPCEKAPSSTIQGSEASAVAQWKGATLYTRKDGPGGEMTFAPLQTKEILTSVLDEKSQPDASCEQNKASPDVEKTDCKTASSQVPLASSERKKIRKKLAANFTHPPTSRSSEESNDDLKKRITEILKTNMSNEPLTTLEVSEKLGMQVRGDAMVLLKELKEDGIVEELAGKISSWKLA